MPEDSDYQAPRPPEAEGTPGVAWRAVKNSAYSLVEFAWPIALSLLVTPFILRGLGDDGYGVLSIVGVTLGFFGLLELGIGGAAIRAVSRRAGRGDSLEAAHVVGNMLTLYLIVGVLGALLVALATPVLVERLLSIPLERQSDARFAFYLAAIGFPISLVVGAFGSVPKAVQRFDLSTKVAVVFATVGPLLTLFVVESGYGLRGVVLASLVLNIVAGFVYFAVARGVLDRNPIRLGLDRVIVRELATFGGWFLVASVGVTVLYQLDKVLVSSLLGVAAVTYYVVPGNLANRIQGFVGASAQVVFPATSALLEGGHSRSLRRLYHDGTRLTFLLAMTLGVPMAVFSKPFLLHWVGPAIAERSSWVMAVLVVTYVLLGMTSIAWGVANGSGRPKINAVFTLGMGVLNVVLFLVLVRRFELIGAAAAYLASAAIGVPMLIATVERRILGLSGSEFLREWAKLVPVVAIQLLVAVLLRFVSVNLVMTLAAMALTAAVLPVLYVVLGVASPEDREMLGRVFTRLRGGKG